MWLGIGAMSYRVTYQIGNGSSSRRDVVRDRFSERVLVEILSGELWIESAVLLARFDKPSAALHVAL